MRKTILGWVLATLASCAVWAIDGRLVGPDGAPLAGARIAVLGRSGMVIADAIGAFTLKPTPDLPFKLVVMRTDGVALKPILVSVLPTEEIWVVRLEAMRNDEVTVISGAVPDLEIPPAAALTVVGRGDLEQRTPTRLADVLEAVPGAGRSEDGASVVPSLRGLPKARTLILLDEGRVTAERRAGPSATFLSPESLDEIEIIRGPGSVAYGSEAFGGVIRARSRMPQPGAPFLVRYSANGMTGTPGSGANVEASVGALGGGILISASTRKAENYESPHGEIDNSGAEETGFRLAYQAMLGNGVLRLSWRSDLGRDIGKPLTDSNVTRAFYPEENSHRFCAAYEKGGVGSWSRLGVSLFLDSYRILTNRDRLETPTKPRQLTQADVASRDYGLRFEAERPIGAGRLVLGVDANGRYKLAAINRTYTYDQAGTLTGITREVSVDSARRDDIGAFVAANGTVGRVRLAAGVRGDRVTTTNKDGYFGDRNTSRGAFSGFASITVPLIKGLDVTLQAARGFRDGLISDRYYRGVSGRGFITGNPDLKPETSRQFDLAARYASGPVAVSLFAYNYRIRELIERYQNGDNFFYRNRGEAELIGLEVEGQLALGQSLRLGLGAQTERGEVLGDHTPVDDIPARGAFLTLRREPVGRFWWMTRIAAYTRDKRPGPVEKVVPGYTVFDASVGYTINQYLQLSLNGRNLLNRSYFGSADAKATQSPGRSIQLVLRGHLGKE